MRCLDLQNYYLCSYYESFKFKANMLNTFEIKGNKRNSTLIFIENVDEDHISINVFF